MCLTAARDAFKAFDKKGEDHIKVGDIEFAMKKMSLTFKSEFLEKMEDTIDTEGESHIVHSFSPHLITHHIPIITVFNHNVLAPANLDCA